MNSDNKKTVTLTEKRIASAKGLHLICAIVAMVLNILSFVVVAINVSFTEIMFLAFPLALAVLDIVFLVKVIFSNYRFAYAITGAVVHSIVVLIVSAAAFALLGIVKAQEGIVFVDFAIYAMIAVHVVQSIATLVTALCATKGGTSMRKICGLLFTVVFIACAGIYGRFLLVDGFFGQGGYTDYRTVVYKYDAATDSYTAIDVLEGYGTDVVIPHQFNGSHVLNIDCALFAHSEITSVQVAWADREDCDKQLGFVGIEHLNYLNPNLELLSPKLYMNNFRKALYKLSEQNHYALELANNVYPSDVKDNEVYISFGYDAETLALVGCDNIIPVWIKEKGTSFDVREHTNVNYIVNSDVSNAAHLHWCHEELSEKIFKTIVDANGNEISGSITESIVNAKVTFENLYHIVFKDDTRETKWSLPDNLRKMYYLENGNEKVVEYIITTESNIQSKIDSVAAGHNRKGFTLAFKTGTDSNKHAIGDIATEIDNLDAAGSREFNVYLEWTLLPPSITNITADGYSENHKAVYGSNVVLDSAATSPANNVSLKYEWIYNGNVIAEGATHTLNNLYPNLNLASFPSNATKAGTYTLRVTAGNDETTSLKSEITKTIEVGFEKKNINFVWVLPEGNNAIYSATDKNSIIKGASNVMGTTYLVDDVINNDEIKFAIFHNTSTNNKNIDESPVRNAGDYVLRLGLLEDTAELYRIDEADVGATFTISPYSVTVDWDVKIDFVYDGLAHAPTASIKALGDDNVTITVLGAQRNYNKDGYIATATTDDTNYVLEGIEQAFVISKRPISIQNWNVSTFVYNSEVQKPVVDGIYNLVEGENISASIIYTVAGNAASRNTGAYNINAALPEDFNYYFTGSVELDYTITKKALAVTLKNETTVYTGQLFTKFGFTNSSVAANDKVEEIFTLDYSKGEAALAINVREGGYVIDAYINAGEKYDNYDITLTTAKLTITKKALTVTIDNVTKTYDSIPFSEFDPTAKVEGLVDGDEEYEVFTLKYNGAAIGAKDYSAGGYEINATFEEGAKFNNYDITLKKATLKINKAPLTIIVVGNEKIYDGKAASSSEFRLEADGLVGAETIEMLGEPKYSGAVLNSTFYAGTHKVGVSFTANEATNNYQITYVQGDYVINKKPITITVDYGTKVYDTNRLIASDFSYAVVGDGLIDGETIEMLGTPTYQINGQSINAAGAKNVGSYEISITALSNNTYVRNYEITYLSNNYVITHKSATVTVLGSSAVYGTKYTFGYADFTIDGLAGSESKTNFKYSFSGPATEGVNVGEYMLSLEMLDMSNYELTYANGGEATFTITKKALTITPSATSGSGRTYDGTVTTVEHFKLSANGLAYSDSLADLGEFTWGGTALDKKNVGSNYTITVAIEDYDLTTIGQNYDITYATGYYTIAKKALTITAVGTQMMYTGFVNADESLYSAVAEGLVDGETLEMLGTLKYGGAATTNKNVNTSGHTLTVSLTDTTEYVANYTVTYKNGTFKITPAPLTITVTANDKQYDGTANIQYSASAEGLLGTDTLTGLGTLTYVAKQNGATVSPKNVGAYTATANISSLTTMGKNYDITYVASEFNITKAPLTITVIANDKVYDGAKNSFSASASGLKSGDTLSALGTLTYSGDVNVANAGEGYSVSVEILEKDLTTAGKNYEITYVGDTFNISKKAITVTVTATNKVYDGTSNNSFGITYSALASGDKIGDLGTPVYTAVKGGVAMDAKDAGTYTVSVELVASSAQVTKQGNYEITYKEATYTISPMKITVTPMAEGKMSDGAPVSDDAFSYVIEGVTNADTIDRIKAELGAAIYGGEAVTATEAGKYQLTVEFADNANYDITVKAGELIITEAPKPENTTGTTTTPVVPEV